MERKYFALCLSTLAILATAGTLIAQPTAPPAAPSSLQTSNPPTPPEILSRTNLVPGRFVEMNNLSPEERRAKIQELRHRRGMTNVVPNPVVGPNERRAKIEARLAELRRKKADGRITPVEERQLHGLETFSQRLHPPATVPQATNSVHEKPAETPK